MRLGNVISINSESIRNGYPFKEIEYIDISSVGSGTVQPRQRLQIDQAPSRAKRIVKTSDTLLATVRPNLRSFWFARDLPENAVASTGFAVLRARTGIDSRFLYFTVTNQSFTDYLTANAKGSAYPAVDTNTIERAEIFLPAIATQRKIAAILSAYDDLIENNERRIRILEEMAQNLYREWFVKFRFPGHKKVKMVDSPLGKIPQGWEMVKVASLLQRLKQSNRYDQKNVLETGTVPVVDQSEKEVLGYHDNEPDFDASPRKPVIIFGDHTCKMEILVVPFSVGPNVVPFIGTDKLPVPYIFYLVRSLVSTMEYKRHWSELINKDVVLASPALFEPFSCEVGVLIEMVAVLKKRNRVLRRIRDLLLPRLISGEVDASELDIRIPENAA